MPGFHLHEPVQGPGPEDQTKTGFHPGHGGRHRSGVSRSGAHPVTHPVSATPPRRDAYHGESTAAGSSTIDRNRELPAGSRWGDADRPEIDVTDRRSPSPRSRSTSLVASLRRRLLRSFDSLNATQTWPPAGCRSFDASLSYASINGWVGVARFGFCHLMRECWRSLWLAISDEAAHENETKTLCLVVTK